MLRDGCPTDQELIEFNLGDLTESRLDEVAHHLEKCSLCEARAERLDGATDEILSALRRSACGDPAWAEWEKALASGTHSGASSATLSTLEQEVDPAQIRRDKRSVTIWADGKSHEPEFRIEPPQPDDIHIEGLEIVESLGEGGMGLVYKARQIALNRIVALKIVRGDPGKLASRFQIEAEAVAQLQHPNIVQIHEVGWCDQRPYLALEFIDGGSLEEKISGKPQPGHEAAEMIRTLALAIDYAHGRGIIHRDLKPSNILLTGPGVPKITDFGVAKRVELDDHQTRDGDLIGTPCYMAPEQASGYSDQIGPPTDVYSLGVIFYEMLTGRVPLQAPNAMETLILVSIQEPVPPRRLQPRIPIDLERIALKCLEKEPSKRYPTALALGEDLGRYLRGEPILARQVPFPERMWRSARRRPVLASLSAAASIGLIAAAIAAWQYNAMLHRFNENLHKAVLSAQENERRAEESEREALANAQAEAIQRRQAEQTLYFSHIALAESEWRNNNVAGAELLLEKCQPVDDRTDYRGWEWFYLKKLSHVDLMTLKGCRDWVHSVAYSPDGKRVVAGAGVPFNLPGTDPLVMAGDLLVWDASTGNLISSLGEHKGAVWSVAYSSDGRCIASASADGEVIVWDAQSLKPIARLVCPPIESTSLTFSPDCKTLAITNARSFRLWRYGSNQVAFESQQIHGDCVPAYRPDGSSLAVGDGGTVVKLLDAATGSVLKTFRGEQGLIRCLAFSPDGTALCSANQLGSVTVWDVNSGLVRREIRGHVGETISVAFSPDGSRIASCSADQTVRIWDLKRGLELLTLRGHTFGVRSIAFHPDGTRLVSGSQDKTVKIWDTNRDPRGIGTRSDTDTGGEWVGKVTFSADNNRLLVVRHDHHAFQVWDPSSGKLLTQHRIELSNKFRCPRGDTSFGNGGRLLAGTAREDDRWIRVWETERGSELLTFREHKDPVDCLALSPDGHWIASASHHTGGPGSQNELILWETKTGKRLRTFGPELTSPVVRLTFSADGLRLATACQDAKVRLWEPSGGRLLLTLTAQVGSFTDLCFSPNGGRLASVAREDPTVRVWELDQGREVLTLRGHKHPLTSVYFSPDGRRIVSAGFEGVVKLWDANSGQEVMTLRSFASQRPGDYYFNAHVVISPDGARISSSTWDGGLSIWNSGDFVSR